MQYDKQKNKFAYLIEKFPFLRILFYKFLDLILLRQWYVKAKIRKYFPIWFPVHFYDAGAGFGQYSYFILKNWKKAEVLAVDIKTDYMDSFSRYAAKTGWQNFFCQQADLVDFIPDKKFDLIIAIDILEHIEDHVQVLKNFKEVLNKKGKLIISSPSNFDESAKFTEEHVRPGYSKEDIISKLEKAEFKIVSFEYSYGKFGQVYWKLCLKFPLSLISKNKLFLFILPFYYLIFYPLSFVFMLLDFYWKNSIGTGIVVVAE